VRILPDFPANLELRNPFFFLVHVRSCLLMDDDDNSSAAMASSSSHRYPNLVILDPYTRFNCPRPTLDYPEEHFRTTHVYAETSNGDSVCVSLRRVAARNLPPLHPLDSSHQSPLVVIVAEKRRKSFRSVLQHEDTHGCGYPPKLHPSTAYPPQEQRLRLLHLHEALRRTAAVTPRGRSKPGPQPGTWRRCSYLLMQSSRAI
jgi:hypothetical protein